MTEGPDKPAAKPKKKKDRKSDKNYRAKTEVTPFEAKRLYDELLKRDERVSARRIAALFAKMNMKANWRTIQSWIDADWKVHGENYATPVADAIAAAEVRARSTPGNATIRVDEILEDNDGLAAAILGTAAYQERELEKIVAAEKAFNEQKPENLDATIKVETRAGIISLPVDQAVERMLHEATASVTLSFHELTRRREYLALTMPDQAGKLYAALGDVIGKITDGFRSLNTIRDRGDGMKTIDGHQVIPPNRKNGTALPEVPEDHPLSAAMKQFERGLGKKAHAS